MFDFLKGGKANVTVALDRPVGPYYLGETVHATVSIEGQKDLKVQEARATLSYREEYQYRHESTYRDSSGHEHTRDETSWTTDEQVVQRQQLMQEGTIAGNFRQTYDFVATIPTTAPPTCEGGKIVRVKWQLKATLDRRLAGDVEAATDLLVFAAPPGRDVGASQYGYSNEPGEAELAFALPGKEWALGETIEGQLVVRPQKVFDASEVRVELMRVEHVPRDRGNEHREPRAVKLAGKTRLEPGQTQTFPFRIDIPAPAPVTSRTRNSSITWRLCGILARSFRGDTRVEEEIFVYSGRPK
jgi:sporulation-control protein spo0M